MTTAIGRQIADLMEAKHPEPADADWVVAESTEDDSIAVLFRGRPFLGAMAAVRRRALTEWHRTLTDAGFTVVDRHDGPFGDDPAAPWWLHVTAA